MAANVQSHLDLPFHGLGAKSNLLSFRRWRHHQLPNRVEHNLELSIIIGFKVIKPASEFGIRCDDLP